jgi:hypothetical protein
VAWQQPSTRAGPQNVARLVAIVDCSRMSGLTRHMSTFARCGTQCRGVAVRLYHHGPRPQTPLGRSALERSRGIPLPRERERQAKTACPADPSARAKCVSARRPYPYACACPPPYQPAGLGLGPVLTVAVGLEEGPNATVARRQRLVVCSAFSAGRHRQLSSSRSSCGVLFRAAVVRVMQEAAAAAARASPRDVDALRCSNAGLVFT